MTVPHRAVGSSPDVFSARGVRTLALETHAPASVIFIRLAVGLVFLSEGIQKFPFPDTLGVGRFATIGLPAPELLAPFVGVVEIVPGTLVVLGLATRLAALHW